MNKYHASEITSLNFENLDIEELERRLELATTLPGGQPLEWSCSERCENCSAYCNLYGVPER